MAVDRIQPKRTGSKTPPRPSRRNNGRKPAIIAHAASLKARSNTARPAIAAATKSNKISDINDLARRLKTARKGKRVVHCHGVFDLLHIGHIRHLAQAREMGDLLVVTVTPDRFVNKGPGRPAFPEQLRAQAIAALSSVDFVAVNHRPTAVQAIELIKPDFYVKGPDYRDAAKDATGGIYAEQAAVEAVGGTLVVTDDITFSSSNLINRYLELLPEHVQTYLRAFTRRHAIDDVLGYLYNAKKLKVLVVGETIIDEYQYCQAIGKSSKEPVLAVRQKSIEKFAGGILAVANHVAGFCDRVGLVSMVGKQDSQLDLIRGKLAPHIDAWFLQREDAPTIVKRRFIDDYFFQKMFEIYEFNDAMLTHADDALLCAALEDRLPHYDAVIVVDFGHGMLTSKAVSLLCKKAGFLAVNTQSNAGNLGYHAISKYPRADLVCLAENELRLESRDRHGDLRQMALDVSKKLNCPRVVATRGSHGCLCFEKGKGFCEVPAVARQVKDRMGAGDTFMAVAALCVAQNAPMEVVGLIGNAAGAQAVATVGHRSTLERIPLVKHVESLLK